MKSHLEWRSHAAIERKSGVLIGMQLTSFVNKHFRTPALIVGSSPNLKKFCFDTYKGIIIGVGDSPLRCINLFRTDYWIFANSYWPRPWCSRDASALNEVNPRAAFIATTMFAYQKPADLPTIEKLIHENVTVPLVIFRAARSNRDEPDISLLNSSGKESEKTSWDSIQDLVAELASLKEKYSSGSSISVHALALALIMGCSPILIVGVDLPYWVHDYKYYSPPGSRGVIKKYGCFGPYCDDFTIQEFKRKSQMLGLFFYRAKLQLSRAFNRFGKPLRSDFGNYKVSLINDFEYLARVAANRVGRTDVFINSNESALSEILGIEFKSCHCGEIHK